MQAKRTCTDCTFPPVVNNLKAPEQPFRYIENGNFYFIPNDGVLAPSMEEVKRMLVARFGFRVVEPPKDQPFDPGSRPD
jgi:hypothetical protein